MSGVPALEGDPLPEHGGKLQRILRRQVISARNNLIRDNVYWKAYEGLRIVVTAIAHTRKGNPDPEAAPTRTLGDRLLTNRLTGFVSMR